MNSVQTQPSPRQVLLARGLTEQQVQQAHGDLLIILKAQADRPDLAFALTALADQLFHEMLDSVEMARYMGIAFGPGTEQHHDPVGVDAPDYVEAWRNTCAAFAAAGIDLDLDPSVKRDDGRHGEICVRTIRRTVN